MDSKSNIGDETISQFHNFIQKATALLGRVEIVEEGTTTQALEADLRRFERFINESKRTIAEHIRKTLKTHRGRLLTLSRSILPESCEILGVAGFAGNEDPYTNLVAWMLWPESNPDLALRLQKAWLEALELREWAMKLEEPAKPRPQFVTPDGRPDLVMHFSKPDVILVVEAKTGAEEHETPGGVPQSKAYLPAVRLALKVRSDHPAEMVFLTPDGRHPADETAKATTYEKLTVVIAEILSHENVSPEMRWAYCCVLTHLLTHTTRGGREMVNAIRQYAAKNVDLDGLTDDGIVADLAFMGPLCRTLRLGESK